MGIHPAKSSEAGQGTHSEPPGHSLSCFPSLGLCLLMQLGWRTGSIRENVEAQTPLLSFPQITTKARLYLISTLATPFSFLDL